MINTNAVRIDYLLYLAGVNVPCTSVTVRCDQGNSVAASVSIPPHPIMFDFGEGDKVQAAIFYLDSWTYQDNPTWCLLMEGYVTSTEYTYTALEKSMTIGISSNISVLKNLYLEFLGGGQEAATGKVGNPGKIIPNQLTFRGRFPGQLFTVGMDNKNDIRSPYEFVQNIFLATTGKYNDKDLTKKGTPLEVSEEVKRIRDLQLINYELKLNSYTTELEKDDFKRRELEQVISKATELGINSQEIPEEELYSTLQGKIVEKQISELINERSLNVRTSVATGFFSRYINICKLHKQIIASPIIEGFIGDSISSKYKNKGMPTGVFPLLRTKNGLRYSKHLAKQSGFKYGDNGSALSLLNNMFNLFSYELQAITAPPALNCDSRGLASGRFSKTSEATIAMLISKPKTLFSFPPACNIILPPLVSSIQYSAVYDQMPTRVYYNKISQLRKLNVDQKNGDGYAYMDAQVGFPAAIARHAYDSTKSKSTGLEVLVFPEEYYAGPKTVYAQLDPFISEMDKLDKSGRLQETSQKINNTNSVDYESIGATQAAYLKEAFIKADSSKNSNYSLFVKQAELDYTTARASFKSCSVAMPFNPYIIVGYSCIVCDSEDVNNHIIGTVISLQHTLSQKNSSTTVTLTGCRPLKGMFEQSLLDGGKYQISPLEPITEVRVTLQDKGAANFYYGNAFYRDSLKDISSVPLSSNINQERKAIIDRIAIVSANIDEETDQEKLETLEIDLEKLEQELSEANSRYIESTSAEKSTFYKAVGDYTKLFKLKHLDSEELFDIQTDIPSDYRDKNAILDIKKLAKISAESILVPNPDIIELFRDYSLAMDYCSRPVCTLEQYIDFYQAHSDLITGSFTGGRGRGCRIGKKFLDSKEGYSLFYSMIREFVGGPGVEPGSRLSKDLTEGLELKYLTEGIGNSPEEKIFSKITGIASATQLPDLAKDWQKLLLTYSYIITNKE
jgi:hypothetical protein